MHLSGVIVEVVCVQNFADVKVKSKCLSVMCCYHRANPEPFFVKFLQ